MSTNTTTGPWGPWQDHIGEGLAHCADYLGRLQRCLAGEIAPTATTSVPRRPPCATLPSACCAGPATSSAGWDPATPPTA